MAGFKHYTPQLNRFLVSVLYHEAKRQKKPMTVVANSLLENALRGSESWQVAESVVLLKEAPPPFYIQRMA